MWRQATCNPANGINRDRLAPYGNGRFSIPISARRDKKLPFQKAPILAPRESMIFPNLSHLAQQLNGAAQRSEVLSLFCGEEPRIPGT